MPITTSDYCQLWNRFKTGDSLAFGQIVTQHYKLLYNYATKFSKDRAFAEDCLQEVFLDLWHNRANLSETVVVKAYLLTAVRNRLLKALRRADLFSPIDELTFVPDVIEMSAEELLITGEQQDEQVRQLRQSILQLTPRQQEIIYLRFYQHLNHDEIAQLLNLSRPSVANLLSIALKELRKKVQWTTITLLFLLDVAFR
jgi:RNA polymerase sigma-70 factor (ECF subfamily)